MGANKLIILGLSFDYHDAAAALLKDGEIIAAAEEERFTRHKHDYHFPKQAISYCLKQAKISKSQIDATVFYEFTLLKFDRIVHAALESNDRIQAKNYLENVVLRWIHEEKFDTRRRIIDYFGINDNKVFSTRHHEAHAAASFYMSPFNNATVITMDGAGEYESLTISVASDQGIKKITSMSLPVSLGLFYSAFTAFCGFEVNEGEYKVMGMSAYGDPIYLDKMRSLIHTTDDGLFTINQEYFEFGTPKELPYSDKLIELFGASRVPESIFRVPNKGEVPKDDIEAASLHYAAIASSLQKRVEEVILHIVRHAINKTGIKNVCLGGGVGLNSLANGLIQRELDCPLYVHPASGDSGAALGAALQHYHMRLSWPRVNQNTNIFLGDEHTDEAILTEFRRHKIKNWVKYPTTKSLLMATVDRLASEKVVGWMQGRFEWGPRALGNRSILADPTSHHMKEIVNSRIKFREPFRPFAPSIPIEYVHEYFDITEQLSLFSPENYMLSVARVRPDKMDIIPAVTHQDGTARVQIVHRETNSLYHQLILLFAERSGVPVLLNTSLNMRGEAMVNDPFDALETFYWSEMDSLIMNNYLLDK